MEQTLPISFRNFIKEELGSMMQELKKDFNDRIDKLDISMKADLSSVKTDVSSVKTDVSTLKTDVSTVNGHLHVLNVKTTKI
jgi:hypothetical protein